MCEYAVYIITMRMAPLPARKSHYCKSSVLLSEGLKIAIWEVGFLPILLYTIHCILLVSSIRITFEVPEIQLAAPSLGTLAHSYGQSDPLQEHSAYCTITSENLKLSFFLMERVDPL